MTNLEKACLFLIGCYFLYHYLKMWNDKTNREHEDARRERMRWPKTDETVKIKKQQEQN
jgi:hypothetical protein